MSAALVCGMTGTALAEDPEIGGMGGERPAIEERSDSAPRQERNDNGQRQERQEPQAPQQDDRQQQPQERQEPQVRQQDDRQQQAPQMNDRQQQAPRDNGNQQQAPQMNDRQQGMPQNNGNQPQSDGQTPPEKPADDQQQGDQQQPNMPGQQGNQQTPNVPGMNGNQQQMPGMPGQQGDQQMLNMPGMNGDQQMPGMPGGMPGEASDADYTAAATVTEDADGASYDSTGDGENAVLVQGGDVTLTNVNVTKTGSSDGESADFNGVNAAVLAVDGATLNVDGASVTTDGAHANGVFSTGAGTTVNVANTTIVTAGNNSGGLMTTGGATMNAENVTVSTSGNSSAAIRSDRGGGTVNANGGSFATTGVGSPAIYSTADITVTGATLTAANSEAVVIEGGNAVTLNDVDISGSDLTLNGQSTQKTNVLIYQSMSGDAAEGGSSFTMVGGKLTSATGSMFHVTNVTTTIDLTGVTLVNAEDSDTLLSATADAWGRAGQNGGNVTLNLTAQEAYGDIEVDEVSSVALNLTDGSDYVGAIKCTGSASVTIDAGSTWILTGDSYVTAFDGDLSNVNLNGFTLYVNGVAIA